MDPPNTRRPADRYDMSHGKRGVCVIVSMENFEPHVGLQPRSSADAVKLAECFSKLGFKVSFYRNLDGHQLVGVINQWQAYDHSDCDVFVMHVLSYGVEDFVYHTTGKIPIEHLLNPFSDENCQTLADKPKLFFLQITPRHSDTSYGYNRHATISTCWPNHPDFVVCVHRTYGTSSKSSVSWFSQALNRIMAEERSPLEEIDIFSLLARISFLGPDIVNSDETLYLQTMTTLRRKLLF